MGGTRTRLHTPVRGVVSLEDRISAAEPGTVDVDLPYHARAHKLWLLAALHYSPDKLVPHRLAVARDVPSSYLNVLHTPQEGGVVTMQPKGGTQEAAKANAGGTPLARRTHVLRCGVV